MMMKSSPVLKWLFVDGGLSGESLDHLSCNVRSFRLG